MLPLRPRTIRRASDWVFITKTRGVELFNAMLLMAAAATFYETGENVVKLPKAYLAKHLDVYGLCILLLVMSLSQWVGLLMGDRDKWRRISVLALTASSAMYVWLATLIFYSSSWLYAIGVHRQTLAVYTIMSVLCWLAADYIKDEMEH